MSGIPDATPRETGAYILTTVLVAAACMVEPRF